MLAKKILAIIPARSGSQGLKNKNILEINNVPLLAYPIIEAKKSKYVTEVILSTDSETYAEIGLKYGAKVPFIRPKELSSNTSQRSDVILHALEKMPGFELILYLEPTSPLTTSHDIDLAVETLLSNPEAKSIVTISESPTHHPDYAVLKDKKNFLKPFLHDSFFNLKINRQDLEKVFFFDGSLYLSYVNYFKQKKEFYHDKTVGLSLDDYKSIEIDNAFDFKITKLLFDERQK